MTDVPRCKLPHPPLVLAVCLAGCASNAVSDEPEVEEIIVQGEKIDRSLQDTTSSVGVLTGYQLEEAGIYELNDVFNRMANVSSAQRGNEFTIRGISNRAVGSNGTSGLASVYIDGAFISLNGIRAGQRDLWDIDQIEVFRGPQSTNQGRSSLAGSVILRSAEPTFTPEGKYRLAYGSYNTRIASIAYGNALIGDDVAFRVSADRQITDGFIDNKILNDDAYGGDSSSTLRGKLLVTPSALESLSVLTTFSYSRNRNGSQYVSEIDQHGDAISPFDGESYDNVDSHEDFDQSIATIEADYVINDTLSLSSISSWNRGLFSRRDDTDHQPSAGEAIRARDNKITSLSQELRLNFGHNRLQGNAGLYLFEQEKKGTINDSVDVDVQGQILALLPAQFPDLASFAPTIAALYPDPALIGRDGFNDQNISNWAIYGNVSYDVSDFLTVFGGVRFDRERVNNKADEARSFVSELPDPATLPTPLDQAVTTVNQLVASELGFSSLNNSANYSAFLPKLGVTLHWDDDINTSFSVQRAYRAGGAGTASSGNYTFDPEFTTNYDLSLRSRWLDQRLTVNANLFYVDWQDQQVQLVEPVSRTEFFTDNAGASELFGAELEISALPTDTLDVYLSVGYVATEFTEFPVDDDLNNDNFTGNEFPGAPELTASTGFSWFGIRDWTIQMDASYQDGSYDNANNTLENDARTLVNAKISYQLNETLDTSLIARNLFDKEYVITADTTEDNVVTIGEPRTFLVQLQGRI